MATFLARVERHGRSHFALYHDFLPATDKAGYLRGELGKLTKLWDVPEEFAGLAVEQIVERWRFAREYEAGVSPD